MAAHEQAIETKEQEAAPRGNNPGDQAVETKDDAGDSDVGSNHSGSSTSDNDDDADSDDMEEVEGKKYR